MLVCGCDSGPASSVRDVPFDSGPEPVTVEVDYPFPDVVVMTTTGMGSGSLRHARIDKNGILTKSRYWGIPELDRQLSSEEHRTIIGKLINHPFPAEGTWEPGCADTPRYEVSFSNQFYDHFYDLDCGPITDPSYDQAFRNRLEFFDEFISLFDMMMNTQAPWTGLETDVRLEDRVYQPSDTVWVDVIVRNPTDVPRTAYFHKNSLFELLGRVGFQTWRLPREQWLCTAREELGFEDDCAAIEYRFAPGDSLVSKHYLPLSEFTFSLGENTVGLNISAAALGYRLAVPDTIVVVRN